MSAQAPRRGEWGSQIGFILAAAGSAVGLGNIWRFPYMAGQNGGGAFVLVYLVCVLVIALPVMFLEISLGRATHRNPVGAIRAVAPRSAWRALGYLALLTGLGILSYYSVIAGKVMTYGALYIRKLFIGEAVTYHGATFEVVIYFALFIVLTVLVVSGGVQRGIERWAKILMPMLVLIMVAIIVRCLLLPGAMEGVKWFVTPDFSKITPRVILNAMSQGFFSLSLGMGAMLTYGSYLSKKDSIVVCGTSVVLFDTFIAILAGFMIFPAVFALGGNPAAGSTLIFQVLPKVFGGMKGGVLVAIVFFFLLCVAALTSTVSLLEVVTAYFVDERRWSRRRSVWTIGGAAFVVGLPSAFDMAGLRPWTSMVFLGKHGFLELMDFLWGNLSLAIGSLLLCVFAITVWGLNNAGSEIEIGSPSFSRYRGLWIFFIKWVCPTFIAIILASKLFS
ncbi:MAG: sodium-dependent transporter [Acidobacteria bacterium]|nr:sodium-dependent transporter [Acidobacteriota bacterium]